MKKIKLSNGVEMPQMGYGVYQVSPDECERCVMDAISVGYRMIDTAQAYKNEESITYFLQKYTEVFKIPNISRQIYKKVIVFFDFQRIIRILASL